MINPRARSKSDLSLAALVASIVVRVFFFPGNAGEGSRSGIAPGSTTCRTPGAEACEKKRIIGIRIQAVKQEVDININRIRSSGPTDWYGPRNVNFVRLKTITDKGV